MNKITKLIASFTHNRVLLSSISWKKKIITLISLFLTGYVLFLFFYAYTAVSFRSNPKRYKLVEFFENEWPHNILSRIIIFRKGSNAYMQDIRLWLYQKEKVADTPWNRWILEQDVKSMSPEECARYLPFYPVTPSDDIIPAIFKAFSVDGYDAVVLLSSYTSSKGKQVYNEWINQQIIRPQNSKLFLKTAKYIACSSLAPAEDVFDIMWPALTESQRNKVVWRTAVQIIKTGKNNVSFWNWVDKKARNGELKINCSTSALLAALISNDQLQEGIMSAFGKQLTSMTVNHARRILAYVPEDDQVKIAELFFEKQKNTNILAAIEFFEHIAQNNIVFAEELASPILSGGDSYLKKSVIVSLIKNMSSKARGNIDDAFTGQAPRIVPFDSIHSYIYGSDAATQYRRLATHDYLETGKTWPPTYINSIPAGEEIAEWKIFVNKYPWFPGTDDAYYRLAFSQFSAGMTENALMTIRDYIDRKEWPDKDAEPYIMYLLKHIALSSEASNTLFPELLYIKMIAENPLGPMVFEPSPNVQPVIDSIDWFLANQESVRILHADTQTLLQMREIATLIQNYPMGARCRIILSMLDNIFHKKVEENLAEYIIVKSESANEDDENEQDNIYGDNNKYYSYDGCSDSVSEDKYVGIINTNKLQATLYGRFVTPSKAIGKIRSKETAPDPGELAILRTAEYLNNSLKNVTTNSMNNNEINELIAWTLVHSDVDFTAFSEEFSSALASISTVDPQIIPLEIQNKYAVLLKSKKR